MDPLIFRAEILGAPCSKANSRRLVRFGTGPRARIASIKSKDALKYVDRATKQLIGMVGRGDVPFIPLFPKGDVRVAIKIFYRNRRPDLDESLVLDVLQGYAYANDRQVKEKHVTHGIDADNPRAEIMVEALG